MDGCVQITGDELPVFLLSFWVRGGGEVQGGPLPKE